MSRGTRILEGIANGLHLKSHLVEQGKRIFLLAVQRNFTKGRQTKLVCAACLYIVCRRDRSPHLLVDFSDVLQMSVKRIGQVYMKLVRLLNFDTIVDVPLIDPSLFMERFATKLSLPSNQAVHEVTQTAIRFVQAMNRDWICTGRRPTGLCGAALLLASRYHGHRVLASEISSVVRMGELTLQRRLFELKQTPLALMDREQFEAMDFSRPTRETFPPAMLNNVQRELQAIEGAKAKMALMDDQRKKEQAAKVDEALRALENDSSSEAQTALENRLDDAPAPEDGALVLAFQLEDGLVDVVSQLAQIEDAFFSIENGDAAGAPGVQSSPTTPLEVAPVAQVSTGETPSAASNALTPHEQTPVSPTSTAAVDDCANSPMTPHEQTPVSPTLEAATGDCAKSPMTPRKETPVSPTSKAAIGSEVIVSSRKACSSDGVPSRGKASTPASPSTLIVRCASTPASSSAAPAPRATPAVDDERPTASYHAFAQGANLEGTDSQNLECLVAHLESVLKPGERPKSDFVIERHPSDEKEIDPRDPLFEDEDEVASCLVPGDILMGTADDVQGEALSDIDSDDVDFGTILTEEEQAAKRDVWNEVNKDYLEEIHLRERQKRRKKLEGAKADKKRKTADAKQPHKAESVEAASRLVLDAKARNVLREMPDSVLQQLFS
eukprot:GEMP01014899.1.p1 GENE.GEMP01014899.1~~GEMP01014899.1.p1  ORF type:complete len:755 (+),score=134.23 GEMP01014899.1:266-2266(+)